MKQEYKFLIDLCNDIKAERDEDGEFNFRWWTSVCDGYETPKSEFVETIINLLIKKDKNFPKREFLKQVHCRIRSGYIYDTLYEKQCDKENAEVVAKLIKDVMEDISYLKTKYNMDFKVPMKVDVEIGDSFGSVEEVHFDDNRQPTNVADLI